MNRRAIAALALAAFAVACGSPLQNAANRLIEQVRLGDPLANQTYTENEELLLSAEAVPIWTDALENSDSPQVQAWAAQMLGAIGDESTLPVLAAAMAGNRDVRDAAVDAIRQFPDAPAGSAFVMALESGNRDAEATALAQISRLETPEAVDVVAGIAGRGDSLTSRSALVTLGDIGTPGAAVER